jgi:uncharacterized membrane protein
MATLAERAGAVKGSAIVDLFIASRPDPDQYRSELVEALRLPRAQCSFASLARELRVDGAPTTLTNEVLRVWWPKQPEYQETM